MREHEMMCEHGNGFRVEILGSGKVDIAGASFACGDVIRGEFYQDTLDGAALRRLREALPEGGSAILELRSDEQYVWAGDGVDHVAATIAEAADQCREAKG